MNKALKKPRCDAKVKNLPDERQAAIFEYRTKHTTEQTARWLVKQKIQISVTALWVWYSWYVTKRNFEELESNILDRMVLFKRRNPKVTQKELDELGEFLFNAMAINRKDIKTWNLAQQIRIKRQGQALQKKMVNIATRKMKLELQKYKDQSELARKVADDTGLSADEKQARIRQILGTE